MVNLDIDLLRFGNLFTADGIYWWAEEILNVLASVLFHGYIPVFLILWVIYGFLLYFYKIK